MQPAKLLTSSRVKSFRAGLHVCALAASGKLEVFTIKLNTTGANLRTPRHTAASAPRRSWFCLFLSCFVSLSNRLKHIEQEVSCGISGQATFWYICISVQRRERKRGREHKGKIKKERECKFVVACHWKYCAENRLRWAAASHDNISSLRAEHQKIIFNRGVQLFAVTPSHENLLSVAFQPAVSLLHRETGLWRRPDRERKTEYDATEAKQNNPLKKKTGVRSKESRAGRYEGRTQTACWHFLNYFSFFLACTVSGTLYLEPITKSTAFRVFICLQHLTFTGMSGQVPQVMSLESVWVGYED